MSSCVQDAQDVGIHFVLSGEKYPPNFNTMEKHPAVSFRKISSPEAFQKILNFLKADVIKNGGTASETIDLHGQLWDITFSSSPWGPILIRRSMTRLEALIVLFESFNEL